MKKIVSLVLTMVMCLSFVPFAHAQAATNVKRLAGFTRFDTMIEISKEGWLKSDCVILVSGANYADALSAVTLAKKYDAPILLTTGLFLEQFITDQIDALEAKKVIIVGGPGAIPETFDTILSAKLLKVERICGFDRYSTSAAVAKQLGEYDTAVVVTGTGYADALSMGPYAAMKGYPILYCNPLSGLTDEIKRCVEGKNIIAVGGEGAVPDKYLPAGYTRIAGYNRYMTSYEIVKRYADAFGSDVVLATGENFPDALAGGALCAKLKAPMLLTENSNIMPSVKSWIKQRNPDTLYVIGGTATISEDAVASIFA